MRRHIFNMGIILMMLFTSSNNSLASERVVLSSIPSDIWHQTVYLIADKKKWMEYENFTVQIGDMGQYVYNFPNWYHGKYDPYMAKADINDDTLDDIIIVLNNDKAVIDQPLKDIHVLNQFQDPERRYEEAPMEPISTVIINKVAIKQIKNIIGIQVDGMNYTIDLSKFSYVNPRTPYLSMELVDYSIEDGKLYATVPVFVLRDDSVKGGLIGKLKVRYEWDGKEYVARKLNFIKSKSEN
ncbi:hypothetical protein K7887_04780 [Sutcliffiella horikoshii]|uniref:hypothetical protein n=1 Tax=Sutcliffiella horikoshii TaxID=79883 RepID=UPI001CBD9741|nr:hypothetical protein [Sutcliffiella horikoshii]UAL48283.1 hypothetical protein K7887_04780 [Sutcliffiella horikoshii]